LIYREQVFRDFFFAIRNETHIFEFLFSLVPQLQQPKPVVVVNVVFVAEIEIAFRGVEHVAARSMASTPILEVERRWCGKRTIFEAQTV